MSGAVHAIDLREGAAADIGLVGAIMAQAFDPRYGEAWTPAQCLGILSLPGVWLTIAYVDGTPVGFALARTMADEAELLLLATLPTARRRGVGGQLLRSVLRGAVDRGAVRVHLEVRAGNSAILLYSREGFVKVGERRDYYRGSSGQAFHAHSYRRDL